MPRGMHGSKRGRVPKADTVLAAQGKKVRQGKVRKRGDTKAARDMAAAEQAVRTAGVADKKPSVPRLAAKNKKVATPKTKLILVKSSALAPGAEVDSPEIETVVTEIAPPRNISEAALGVWAELADVVHHTGVSLKPSDARALATLCEDEVLLSDAYASIQEGAEALRKEAAEQGTEMKTLPLAFYMADGTGRKLAMLLNTLSARVMNARNAFGLTPAARLRFTGGGDLESAQSDPLEDALSA